MTGLTLYHDKRHAFVCHLDGVRVAELVRRGATADSGELSGSSQLLASSRGFPMTTCRCPADHTQQGTDR